MRRLLVILVTLASATALADDAAKARLEAGEVQITTRSVPGSSLPEVTAKAVINAPPERLWAILQDCGNYQKNLTRVVRSRELSRTGAKVVCEVEIALPFPLSNLTSVTEATHVVGPPVWSRTWHLLRGDFAVNEGAWTLTRYGDNPQRTLAVYRLHTVPKSVIPDAILRRAQRSTLPDLFNHLRELTKG